MAAQIALGTNRGVEGLIRPRTARRIGNAVITMALSYRAVPDGDEIATLSTCGETFNDLTRIVEGLRQSLADGDLNAYDTLVNCFGAESRASGASLDQLRSEIQGSGFALMSQNTIGLRTRQYRSH